MQADNGDVRGEVYTAVVANFGPNSWPAAEYVIDHESGFNPYAINKSSGACGLGQALPCSKMGCDLSNVPCQINWLIGYFRDHWGTPDAAYNHEVAQGWY